MAHKILVVDDEELIRWSLAEDLTSAGYKVSAAASAEEAYKLLAKDCPDAVLTDLRLGTESGLDVLRRARKESSSIPIILMTGFADLSSAVEALREGAADYIAKPLQLAALKITLERVLETASLRTRLAQAHQKRRDKYSFDTIVAASPAMKESLATARKIAASPQGTVLIVGESGCGKDRIARAIHYEGARVTQPFVEISCTALPEQLLESELFGYEKGAFTGADKQKKGLFEMAEGGTVFLNEIGHMPLSLQAKVLRVLEDKTFKRVGGVEDVTVDVRILAATNEDLERAVESGKFRCDLYYRINVLSIRLRPLRERKEDILPLTELLLDNICRDLRKSKPRLDEPTRRALLDYRWPGNVRELRNVLERMAILGETTFIPPCGPMLRERRTEAEPAADREPAPGLPALPDAGLRLEDLERAMVEQALKRSDGNQQKAAGLLGISRDALRRRMEKFGLKLAAACVLVAAALATASAQPKPKADAFAQAHQAEALKLSAAKGAHAPVKDGACSKCHSDPKDPKKLAAQPRALCLSCHPGLADPPKGGSVHAPFKDGDCSQCHDPHASELPRLLSQDQKTLCTMCHAVDEGAPLRSHQGIKTIEGACTDCHAPHFSGRAKLAVEGGHAAFERKGCASCHAASKDGKASLKEPLAEACFACHGALKEKTKAAVVHPPFAAGDCAQCHQPHASRVPGLLRQSAQDLCRTCHPDIPDVGHPAFQHPSFRTGKGDPRRKGRPYDCASCHDAHGWYRPKLVNLPAAEKSICVACHDQ